VKRSTRTWLIAGIEIIFAGVALWMIPRIFEYVRAKLARERVQHSRPSEAVERLLNRIDAADARIDGTYACVFASIVDSRPQPALGKCAMPTERSGPVDRFEVDLRYGNFILRQSDLYLNDVFNVPLTRSYNSGDYVHPNHVHAFGKNANHPYDWTVLGTRNPYTYMMAVLEDGDYLFFPRVSRGVGYADAIYQHTETSTGFYESVIAWNGDGWTLFRRDGAQIVFPESYNGTSAAKGAPYAIRDSDGNILSLTRDSNRNLTEIRTPNKHWIQFQYDRQSRIIRAEDDQGHSVAYVYNDNGMLWDAKFSSGFSRHYTYDGDLMIFVSDQNHRVLVTNSYSKRWLVRQDFGNRQVFSYSYAFSEPKNYAYAASATVTLPDGTMKTVEVGSSVPEERKHHSD
jgi:YD repeat-containing protein